MLHRSELVEGGRRRHRWTPEDDNFLFDLIAIRPALTWERIAFRMEWKHGTAYENYRDRASTMGFKKPKWKQIERPKRPKMQRCYLKPPREWSPDEIERAQTLRDVDGLSMSQIGAALGRTENSIIGRLWRHRKEGACHAGQERG